jgi:hypothetical protein
MKKPFTVDSWSLKSGEISAGDVNSDDIGSSNANSGNENDSSWVAPPDFDSHAFLSSGIFEADSVSATERPSEPSSVNSGEVGTPISKSDENSDGHPPIVPGFDIQAFLASSPWTSAGITEVDTVSSAKGGPGSGGSGGGGASSGGSINYFSGATDGDQGYDIWLEFKGSGWTDALMAPFRNAADYFTWVITDDIGGGGLYRGKFIDDLYVSAELKSMDGQNGVLGQGGPSATWTSNDLTAVGQMQFDIADVPLLTGDGLWDDTATHELMHVLGFGSLWNYGKHTGLVSGNSYVGSNAVAAYGGAIPIEDGGGSGTVGSHWDETALTNELMTGYINTDHNPTTVTDNYLSKFSVEVLADLNYKVDYHDYSYDGIFIA